MSGTDSKTTSDNSGLITEVDLKLHKILFPYAAKQVSDVEQNGTRFVHYTNATAAAEILRNAEFWMREPSCMNDYMEVEHGLRCIDTAYSGDGSGKSFRAILEDLQPGLNSAVQNLFREPTFHPRTNNYVACFSEHRNSEDHHGRLSMWRAYGNGTGIAMVMNSMPFFHGPGVLKLFTSPAAYFDNSHFEEELKQITENIRANFEFIKQVDQKVFSFSVLNMLRFAALSAKHPGFSEEMEWRLIYSPLIANSPHMKKEISAIGGVPQTIYKIPLRSSDDGKITGGELPDLIERIIIGPTQYPATMYRAFVDLLTQAGIASPENKVIVSQIPLRT